MLSNEETVKIILKATTYHHSPELLSGYCREMGPGGPLFLSLQRDGGRTIGKAMLLGEEDLIPISDVPPNRTLGKTVGWPESVFCSKNGARSTWECCWRANERRRDRA